MQMRAAGQFHIASSSNFPQAPEAAFVLLQQWVDASLMTLVNDWTLAHYDTSAGRCCCIHFWDGSCKRKCKQVGHLGLNVWGKFTLTHDKGITAPVTPIWDASPLFFYKHTQAFETTPDQIGMVLDTALFFLCFFVFVFFVFWYTG
jgi:hypothetical protein